MTAEEKNIAYSLQIAQEFIVGCVMAKTALQRQPPTTRKQSDEIKAWYMENTEMIIKQSHAIYKSCALAHCDTDGTVDARQRQLLYRDIAVACAALFD